MSKIKSDAPAKPEEYDPKSEYSHAVDSLRFLCMEFPVQSAQDVDPRDVEVRKWDAYIAAARARQNPKPQSYSGSGYE